jgi:CBS domain-containing protein
MKVKEVLKRAGKPCTPLSSLDTVGKIMWEENCGAVPVVDADGKALGIVTDRDLALALTAKNRGAAQILVREILVAEELFSCREEDELAEAIRKMRAHKVRRLPVLDAQGQLLGLLSLKDLALAAKAGAEPSYEDIALTLQEVSKDRRDPGERTANWPWIHAATR